MYFSFYGLKESPFSLVSDPRYLYYSASHCEAMAHLLYGVRERKGIILMLGEAGTGKTTLVRATLEMLRSTRVVTSVIMNPLLRHPDELLEAILRGFGLEGFRRSSVEMADVLQRYLLQQANRGRIPTLIVDEAQDLSQVMLEQLRLLSNLEYRGEKLLQFILAAQPEMGESIERYELRALRQRIVVRCRLAPLTPEETWSYLNTRLLRAGSDGREIFTPAAVEAIYHYTGGIARLINMVADNALLAGYARGMCPVQPAVVESVARHQELKPVTSGSDFASSVHNDVVRASASWGEVVQDLRNGAAPEPLRQFVEQLRAPEETPERFMTAAPQGKR